MDTKDTSIATAIAGSENHFTVYGSVKSTNGRNSVTIAILFSGIKDGNNLDSLVVGAININDTLDIDHIFIKEGQARIAYDGDYVSEPTDFDNSNSSSSNYQKRNSLLHSIKVK